MNSGLGSYNKVFRIWEGEVINMQTDVIKIYKLERGREEALEEEEKNKRNTNKIVNLFCGKQQRLGLLEKATKWRSFGAFCLVLVLVVFDVLPVEPAGLPDVVEAADPTPKTGTIEFYEYELAKYDSSVGKRDFNKSFYENGQYSRLGMFIYEYDGTCYVATNQLTSDGKWPTFKLDSFGWDFTPGVDAFYARKYTETYSFYRHGYFTSIIFHVDDDYYGLEANSKGIYHYKIDKNSLNGWYLEKWSMSMYSNANKIWIFDRNTAYMMSGYNSYIGLVPQAWFETGTEIGTLDFWCYNPTREKKTYTCINEDFRLGDNQVYVAEDDLFLSENVKLTIPEGAVLCVKNGPFYVNGEIDCSGTILVEDGGVIIPYESTAAGSKIILENGGAMIIRNGGRVYAGCPKGSLGTMGDQGWLVMHEGSSIINYGLLVAGQCNFNYGRATIENHKGGEMGYTVDDRVKFMSATVDGKSSDSSFGLVKTSGTVHYGKDANTTVLKLWDGATTTLANKATGNKDGETVKVYSYDKDGKCTINNEYTPQ